MEFVLFVCLSSLSRVSHGLACCHQRNVFSSFLSLNTPIICVHVCSLNHGVIPTLLKMNVEILLSLLIRTNDAINSLAAISGNTVLGIFLNIIPEMGLPDLMET